MWQLIAVSACLIGLAAVLIRFREIDDGPARLLLLGLWLRYAMQAFPDVFTAIRLGPFSLIAAVSIMTAILFLIVLDHRLLRLRSLLPVYLMLSISLLSGVVNAEPMGVANDVIKWGYFIGVMLLSFRVMSLYGPDRALRALLATLITPALLFAASVATGNAKATELDGSISYIGGYVHESMFSSIMFSIFALGCLIRWRSPLAFVSIIAFSIAALVLVNYRAAIVALAPALLALCVVAYGHGVGRRYSVAAAVALAVLLLGGIPFALDALPARYAEITDFVNNYAILSKDPIELTESERAIFSHRVNLWAGYLYSYRQGDLVTHLIGYGPNAHEHLFRLIPHSTFISALWELGVVGLFSAIFMAVYYCIMPMKIKNFYDRIIVASLMCSVVVNGIASMPLWTIEGLINFAHLAAYTAWRIGGRACADLPRRTLALRRAGFAAPARPA